ncbi:MAG: cytochrome c oxidase subunit II transmembrane domain-containing protein, partial [Pseudomonadales bacterium]
MTKPVWLAPSGGLAMWACSGVAFGDELNMPVGVTDVSRKIYDLHTDILLICVVIGLVLFSAMLWSIVHHRKAAGYEAAQFHESTRLEIAWTLIPVAILIAVAYPATRVLIDIYDTGGEDLTIEVRGYQWRWQYKYLDEDFNNTFGFFS